MHHWGPEHIIERAEDLVEDYAIEQVNELGIIDEIDAVETVLEDPFDMDAWMKTVVSMRWMMNFFGVAFPWAGWSFLMFLYNIVFNSWLNKGWAEGNLFLLYNTVFLII